MKLYLASTSPRRRELLGSLGISFEVIPPLFEEHPTSFFPAKEAMVFAEEKAESVKDQCPDALVLASDTIVAIEGHKFGKPKDENDAVAMLKKLSGKTHQINTAVALLNTASGEKKSHLEIAHVTFRSLTEKEIRNYVATGEPMDKAGAYAIQGEAKGFVEKVYGDIDAVIGLPLAPIRQWLGELSLPLGRD